LSAAKQNKTTTPVTYPEQRRLNSYGPEKFTRKNSFSSSTRSSRTSSSIHIPYDSEVVSRAPSVIEHYVPSMSSNTPSSSSSFTTSTTKPPGAKMIPRGASERARPIVLPDFPGDASDDEDGVAESKLFRQQSRKTSSRRRRRAPFAIHGSGIVI
ncbi:hypothetical protein LTS18_001243, partial [Coniosporium uncinatum]